MKSADSLLHHSTEDHKDTWIHDPYKSRNTLLGKYSMLIAILSAAPEMTELFKIPKSLKAHL